MIAIKIFITIFLIIGVLLLKEIFKLQITKKCVTREILSAQTSSIDFKGKTNSFTLTPLIDFYALDKSFKTEAGVSYYIETDKLKILLDVGANAKKEHPSPLLQNMDKLGISPDSLDFIFISHVHLDHVGGTYEGKNKLFSLSAGSVKLPDIPVYSPSELNSSPNNPVKNIQIIKNPKIIGEGVASIGVIPRALFLAGYTEEHSLAFNLEGKGIILVIGCGHQSIERIIERAQKLFSEPVYGIIGGLHLPARGGRMKIGPFDIQRIVGTDRMPWNGICDEDTEKAIQAIKKAGAEFIALSPHDSSDWTIQRFKEEFGEKYSEIYVGEKIIL